MKLVCDFSLTSRPIRPRGPSGPVLSVNFLTGSQTPVGSFALTRAGSATHINASGALVTAAADVPRFDHDPVTLAPRGLLVEAAATNLYVRASEFNDASWVKANTTVTADNFSAPDGSSGADAVLEAATNSSHAIGRNGVLVVAGWNTVSIYIRPAGRTFLQLRLSGADTIHIAANLTTRAVTFLTPQGASVARCDAVGGNWLRLSLSWQSVGGLINNNIFPALSETTVTYQGAGIVCFHLWGAQLEAGSTPTSYIPTTTAATTRAADQPLITPNLGVRDVRVTTDAGVIDLTGQNLNGSYWPSLSLPARVQKVEVL